MLEPQCRIPVEQDQLDPKNYTLSLMEACRRNGLLEDERCRCIRQVLDQEFAETAAEYTKRGSSTMPRSVARQLYDAVLFRWDACLKSMSVTEGIRLLQAGEIREIGSYGMERILDAFSRCRALFRAAYALRCPLPIGAYQYVMENAFDQFCNGYSARFDPRNDCMGVDYPLLGRQAYELPEEGVWFVERYYTCMLLENQLCRMIPEGELTVLLAAYARIYHSLPEDLHISAAELVVNQLLTGVLVHASPLQVQFSDHSLFQGTPKPDAASLGEAFHRRYHRIFAATLMDYILGYIPQFVRAWRIRAGYRSLANWIVLPVPTGE